MPEIKLAEMRRHLSLAPLSLWTGKDGRTGTDQPIVFHEVLLNGWAMAFCTSVCDKRAVFVTGYT